MQFSHAMTPFQERMLDPYSRAHGHSMDVFRDPFFAGFGGSSLGLPSMKELMKKSANMNEGLSPILQCDIVESGDDFHLHLDLPGVDAKDLDVDITDTQLVIKGERRNEYTEDTDLVHRSERSYGKVCRTIALPPRANSKDASAKFENGVLHVTLPKMQGEKISDARKLEIK